MFFWGIFYGCHLYLDQDFKINKSTIKKSLFINENTFLLLKNSVSSYIPLIIIAPLYQYKYPHADINALGFLMIGTVLFISSYLKDRNETDDI